MTKRTRRQRSPWQWLRIGLPCPRITLLLTTLVTSRGTNQDSQHCGPGHVERCSKIGICVRLWELPSCSSSYATDLNFSLISAMSYLGLVYLAMIFLYKSILRSGSREFDVRAERCMIGEEEAIWMLRFLLPYINEVC
ncbi:reticulon-like protein B21 isoform X1 [Iris pallida]|uniref:Reticulon-like protein B21 isoform X1 n=1 Tax=Iris pallida TaxID=29817 RepID=A0AAX6F9L1_IRIPA|nr:reticulon-like protein B21 isoform X1 [Iris pallida]